MFFIQHYGCYCTECGYKTKPSPGELSGCKEWYESEFNYDLAAMKIAVESEIVTIPESVLTNFTSFDEWFTEDHKMNKQIRDFAEQAGYIPGEITSEAYNEFNIDRFAKLIIEATCDIVKDEVQYELNYTKAESIVMNIKRHFEVT
jgi:hypothetical protein